MFKTLKDARRRVVESVLEGVGATERTVDDEFDMFVNKFNSMMQDLNECGAGLHSILTVQKTYFSDAVELTKSLSRVHEQYADREFWPNTENHLDETETAALIYKEKMQRIHEVYRSSCALINVERGLEPLRESVTKLTPEIEGMIKERNTQLIDYDSYRRRLKGLREKQDNLETHGKGNTPAAQDNLAEIAKFEGKESIAKEVYENKNDKTKDEIRHAKALHDELLTNLFVTTVVCQSEIFSRAAHELEDLLNQLPADKVKEARKKVSEVIGNGGIQLGIPDKTKLQKGVDLFTGKAVPSDYKKEKDVKTNSTASAASVSSVPIVATAVPVVNGTVVSNNNNKTKTSSTNSNSKAAAVDPLASANPFGADDDEIAVAAVSPKAKGNNVVPPPPPAASAPPLPPVVAAVKAVVVTVEALFDHEAEADDELSFKAGDQVEVLETSDDGWWVGRCHGKEGLFPVNYVKTGAADSNPF